MSARQRRHVAGAGNRLNRMQIEEPNTLQARLGQHSMVRARFAGRLHPGPAAFRMLRLLASVFRTPARWRALGLLVATIAATTCLVLLILRLTQWNADFFDVVEQKSWSGLIEQSWIFVAIVLANMVLQASSNQAKRMLQIELRGHLTRTLIDGWMVDGRHYQVRASASVHDNEDGRIAEDARVVCEMVVDFLSSFFYALLQLVLFVGVLWLHSGTLALVVGGVSLSIPGYMVFVALAYAAVAAVVIVWIGYPLVHATDRRQAAEASFREGLVRSLANAQAIALTRAETAERGRLAAGFERVRFAWATQTRSFRNMIFLSSGFGLLTAALPMLILAPQHFSGAMSLGTLMQVTIAFGQVTAALSWLSDNYPLIAQWEASAERVLALEEAVEDVADGAFGEGVGRIARVVENGPGLAFRNCTIVSANGELLVTAFDAEIAAAEKVLIEATQPAAAALFRALAGLSVWGSGRIELPEGASPFFMGERPYLPDATLAEILADPRHPADLPAEALADALIAVGLTQWVPSLDTRATWSDELGIEDQQRLGFARALVQQPRWIFMLDATSALEDSVETRLTGVLVEKLPGTAIVTIAHRPVNDAYYQRRIGLSSGGG